MFGRKSKTAPTVVAPEIAKNIHRLPERFYFGANKNSHRLLIWLGLGTIVMLLVVLAVIFFAKQNPSVTPPPDTPTAVGAPVVAPPTPPPTPRLNQPTPVINANTTPITNSQPIPQPAAAPVPTVAPTDFSDTDGDGISDTEEKLYGSLATSIDSDNDTFPDKTEILNGFDPGRPKKSLVESNLVRKYVNDEAKMSLWYPTAWFVNNAALGSFGAIFDSRVGDSIRLIKLVNTAKTPPLDFVIQQSKKYQPAELTQKNINGRQAVVTSDGMDIFVFGGDGSRVYYFSYVSGTTKQKIFSGTFDMMTQQLVELP